MYFVFESIKPDRCSKKKLKIKLLVKSIRSTKKKLIYSPTLRLASLRRQNSGMELLEAALTDFTGTHN